MAWSTGRIRPWARCRTRARRPRGAAMFARHFLDRRLDRLGHPPIELVARVPDLNQSHAAVGRSRDVKRQAVGPILWPIDSLRDGVVVLGLEPVEFHDDSDG